MGATLNWHRDPGYEQRMLRLRQGTEQIRRETEQLKLENAKLRQLNARGRELLSCAWQLCSLPDSSSIPVKPTETD